MFEYADIFLKQYKEIVGESVLTSDDTETYSFYQGYPYSVNIAISNSRGTAVVFVPNSTDENTVVELTYPIENYIPEITDDEKENMVIGLAGEGTNSTFNNINLHGSWIYIENSTDSVYCNIDDNSPILLADGIHFNGVSYIDAKTIWREGNITLNGKLVLDKTVILKSSNLKTEWTNEKAVDDSIDLIYKEAIDDIYYKSKLTGIGYYELEELITEYRENEISGFYKVHVNDKWEDRNKIFNKADEYGISQGSVALELSQSINEKTQFEKFLAYMGDIMTIRSLILSLVAFVIWVKGIKLLKS
ncbi:hypothetical protein [Methanolobus profundi]|nr:hypothetical protein [Methanolobus profundi]